MPKGGKRKGAGRKPHFPPLKKRIVVITDEQARLLRMWGKGSLSAGLRWMIDQVKEMVYKPREEQPPPGGPHSSG